MSTIAGENSFDNQGLPPEQQSPYAPLFGVRRIWLAVTLIAVAVFVAGLLLDLLLIHIRFVSQVGAAVVLDAVFAAIVAGLIYKLLAHEQESRKKVLERLETIEEMNHHIRNALQVISFNAGSEADDLEVAELKRAMDRIQWALREILPRVEPAFTSFEGSVREQKGFDSKPPAR